MVIRRKFFEEAENEIERLGFGRPGGGVGAPTGEQRKLAFVDVAHTASGFDYGFVVGERGQFDIGGGEGFGGHGETIGEAGHHAENFETGCAKGFDGFEAASAGGDEVFDYHNACAFGEGAFDEVAHAVVFGFRTNVAHGESEFIGDQRTLCNGTRGYTGNGGGFGILATNEFGKLLFHERAHLRISERFAIVTIERRQPTTRPSEGLGGLNFDALNAEQLLGELGSNGGHYILLLGFCGGKGIAQLRKDAGGGLFGRTGGAETPTHFFVARQLCATRGTVF